MKHTQHIHTHNNITHGPQACCIQTPTSIKRTTLVLQSQTHSPTAKNDQKSKTTPTSSSSPFPSPPRSLHIPSDAPTASLPLSLPPPQPPLLPAPKPLVTLASSLASGFCIDVARPRGLPRLGPLDPPLLPPPPYGSGIVCGGLPRVHGAGAANSSPIHDIGIHLMRGV